MQDFKKKNSLMQMLSRIFLILSQCFILLIFIILGFEEAANGKIALIIGNQTYKKVPLDNPLNDARDIARSLAELGFEVILLEDVDRRKILDSVNVFSDRLKNKKVGLLYYSGHGVQINGENYIIPLDTNIASASDVEFESVNVNRIMAKMEEAGKKLFIIILDACRNNPFPTTYRSTRQGLAMMNAPAGSIIAYSTAPGSVAFDGQGRNSPYTMALLKFIKKANIPIEMLFKYVRQNVSEITSGKQVPWESTSLSGDFCFKNTNNKNLSKQKIPKYEIITHRNENIPDLTKGKDIISKKRNDLRSKVKKCGDINIKMSMGLMLTPEEIEFALKKCKP